MSEALVMHHAVLMAYDDRTGIEAAIG